MGCYHSRYGERAELPSKLALSAETCDEARLVMALEHRALPLQAVQFHPELIMSTGAGRSGLGNKTRSNAPEDGAAWAEDSACLPYLSLD